MDLRQPHLPLQMCFHLQHFTVKGAFEGARGVIGTIEEAERVIQKGAMQFDLGVDLMIVHGTETYEIIGKMTVKETEAEKKTMSDRTGRIATEKLRGIKGSYLRIVQTRGILALLRRLL